MGYLEALDSSDPDLAKEIRDELKRQREGLEMIPSENFTSVAVMEALGSILTNKYSEGYPGKRYYGGNQNIDLIERRAIERAKSLFGVAHANVQAYSGSPANFAVYMAVCSPGDTIMGQNLADGGHLTHGSKASLTGKLFNSVPYHVNKEGYLDIKEVRALALEYKPKLIWVGSTAYPRKLPFKEFGKIADECGAYLAADISHISGLIAGEAHESPVSHAHIITTTTHKTLRGPRGAIIMVSENGLDKDPDLPDKIDKTIFPGMQGGPHDHVTAGIAVALKEASSDSFKEYAKQIVRNSVALADGLNKNGMRLVTGGSDNHLILIDLTQFGPGKGVFAQEALDAACITTNKNTIPNEPSSPFYPSGLRLGTPALTTRGMKEGEMEEIGMLISRVIKSIKDYELPLGKAERSLYLTKFREELKGNKEVEEVRGRVFDMCKNFPLYPDL